MVVVATQDIKMLCCKVMSLHIQKYSEAFENAQGVELFAGL